MSNYLTIFQDESDCFGFLTVIKQVFAKNCSDFFVEHFSRKIEFLLRYIIHTQKNISVFEFYIVTTVINDRNQGKIFLKVKTLRINEKP